MLSQLGTELQDGIRLPCVLIAFVLGCGRFPVYHPLKKTSKMVKEHRDGESPQLVAHDWQFPSVVERLNFLARIDARFVSTAISVAKLRTSARIVPSI